MTDMYHNTSKLKMQYVNEFLLCFLFANFIISFLSAPFSGSSLHAELFADLKAVKRSEIVLRCFSPADQFHAAILAQEQFG